MRQVGAIGLVLLGFAAACGQGELIVLPMPAKNPTSYDFDLPMQELRAKVLMALTVEHQVETPIFGPVSVPSAGLRTPAILHVSDSTNPVFGAELFRVEQNVNDLYLQNFHEALWNSPVYRGTKGGLPFLAEFHLHFSQVAMNRTRITVATYRTEVVNGETFDVRHIGPGWFPRYVSVEPTTIEEYTVLRYLGEFVGMKTMPPVSAPGG